MQATESELLGILSVAQDASIRGEGLSLREALKRCHYRELRSRCAAEDLVPLLEQRPEVIEQWMMWCDDKRTSGGWFITDEEEIGRVSSDERIRHRSLPEAMADYVVRELDFWANVRA